MEKLAYELQLCLPQGYLKTEAGLKYLQEALNNQLKDSWVEIKLVSFKDNISTDGSPVTELSIKTNWGAVPHVVDTILKAFNRRKRWIVDK